MVRTISIWACGLSASAIIGGFVGDHLDTSYRGGASVWGFLAGLLAFICLRLWLAKPSDS